MSHDSTISDPTALSFPDGLIRIQYHGRKYAHVARDLHPSLTGRDFRFTAQANQAAQAWLSNLPLTGPERAYARRCSDIGGNWTWVAVPHRYERAARELLASLPVEQEAGT